MTPEDNFIKELKMFYDNDETIINDVSEKRIRMLLEIYKSEIPPVFVKKEVVVEKKVMVYDEKIANKPNATNNDYIKIAKLVCDKYRIPMTTLRRTIDNSRVYKNVSARIEFSKQIRNNFYTPITEIGKFLNVDHTTVLHYLKQ